eukprot:NODE_16_length_41655_cov_0.272813.p26 type:complete len:111 gc:universal NODE_16_length_41655_cov_0.272813:529-197(-)
MLGLFYGKSANSYKLFCQKTRKLRSEFLGDLPNFLPRFSTLEIKSEHEPNVEISNSSFIRFANASPTSGSIFIASYNAVFISILSPLVQMQFRSQMVLVMNCLHVGPSTK